MNKYIRDSFKKWKKSIHLYIKFFEILACWKIIVNIYYFSVKIISPVATTNTFTIWIIQRKGAGASSFRLQYPQTHLAHITARREHGWVQRVVYKHYYNPTAAVRYVGTYTHHSMSYWLIIVVADGVLMKQFDIPRTPIIFRVSESLGSEEPKMCERTEWRPCTICVLELSPTETVKSRIMFTCPAVFS